MELSRKGLMITTSEHRFGEDDSSERFCVTIREVMQEDYGLYVWPCSIVLAEYVWQQRSRFLGSNVVELGAGTALPGIVAAKLGSQVTLTDACDRIEVLENMKRTCELNEVNCEVCGLTWGEWTSIMFDLHPQILLGADVLYESTDFDDLLATVSFILTKNPNSTFIISYQRRGLKKRLIIVKELQSSSMAMTSFDLLLRHSKGKEISRPGATRFATYFLSLHNLLDARVPLGFTFISEEWTRNDDFLRLRINIEGMDVASLVKENHYPFWSTMEEVVKISKPLVHVLHLVDGDQTSMGYMYEAMERAKESIQRYYKNNEDKFQPIWNIIDQRWNKTLHKPIHGASHLLNPSFFNEPTFNLDDAEIRINFCEVVEKMYPSSHEWVRMHDELQQYISQTIDAFSKVALEAAKTLRPDAWWDAFGFSLPNLRKFAHAILGQPTSASACERNWSIFNNMQAKKRHLLSSKRLNDLVFVNFNMLLHERQLLQKNTQVIHLEDISLDPPLVEAIPEHLSGGSDDDTRESPPNVNPSYVSFDHEHDLVERNDSHLDEDWDATGISH